MPSQNRDGRNAVHKHSPDSQEEQVIRTILLSLSVAWGALAVLGFLLDGLWVLLGRIRIVESGYAALCISGLAVLGATCGRAAEQPNRTHSHWIRWLSEPLFGLIAMMVYAVSVTALAFVFSMLGLTRAWVDLQPLLLLIFPVYLVMSIMGRWARNHLAAWRSGTEWVQKE